MSADDVIGVLSSMGESLVHLPLDEFIDSLKIDARLCDPKPVLLKRLAQAAKLLQETYAEILFEAEKARVFN